MKNKQISTFFPKEMGVWRNGRRYGLKKLSLVEEILQVDALKLRET
ncbi:MAG: hypothetical protein WBF90_05875 [Rivularia sp. (in: cyanobacteria)]